MRLCVDGLAACVWAISRGLPAAAAASAACTNAVSSIRSISPRSPRAAAVLAVPENPAEPPAASIDLFVAVVPALNRRASGAALCSCSRAARVRRPRDLYASYAGAFARINRNHDIVLVDQRGTGPIGARCSATIRKTGGETRDELPALRQATLACLARYGERVRFYTTSVAVARPRAGARGARLCADRSLRRLLRHARGGALPAPSCRCGAGRDPRRRHLSRAGDRPRDTRSTASAPSISSWRAAGLRRIAPPPIPIWRAEFGALRAKFGPESVVLDASPDPSTGEPLELEFNRGVLAAALRLLSYNATQASLLPTLIHQAALGPLRAARRADRDDGARDPRTSWRAACRTASSAARMCRSSPCASIGSGSMRPTRAPINSMRWPRSASSGRRVRWTRICTRRCTATCRPCCCRARPIR